MGLPSVKSVGEYETKYGNVTKEDALIRDTSVKQTSGQLFYGDPQKKIKSQQPHLKVTLIQND